MSSRSGAATSFLEEVLAGSQGWLWTACILAMAALPPLALGESAWVPGMHRLVLLTVPAAAVGLTLAGQGRRWWLAPALVLGGLLLSLLIGADPLSQPDVAVARVWQAARRLYWWANVLWLGGSNDDPLVPTVAAAWLLWLACVWLGIQLGARRSVMSGVLPIGVVLAANSFYTLGGWAHLVAFVALTMVLLALGMSRDLQARSAEVGAGADRPEGVASLAIALPVAAVAVALAVLLPPVAWEGAADAFWARAERPWRTTVRLVKWLFPGLSPGAATSPWLDESAGAAMPSARDLVQTAAPEDTVVMLVQTSDPPPLGGPGPLGDAGLGDVGPKRYWRGMTYDVYTGRGWANTRTDAAIASPGSRFQVISGSGREVVQSFQIIVPRDELLFSLAEPLSLNVEARLHWRGEGDFAYAKAALGRYEVVSRPVEPTVADLRAAGSSYPLEVRDRYLAIPAVPDRLQRLAGELASAGGSAYDTALNIEAYLRANYEYDLEVGEPALEKDVVDYFLFESKRGFCDHYASAMVVLARLAGVPARLASGYTSGTYDYDQDLYVVRAANAHSWPEVYFPGIGWVPFEPTVTQATFSRPLGASAPPAGPVVAPDAKAQGSRPRPGWLLLVAVAAGTTAAAWIGRRRVPADPVLRAYWTMQAAGTRLGVDGPAATPREYAALLDARLDELRPSGTAGLAAASLAEIAHAYEERRYRSPGAALGLHRSNWRRSEVELWLLVVLQAPRALLSKARGLVRRRLDGRERT